MKKRLSVIAVITLLSIILVSALSGCASNLTATEGTDYLKQCIEKTSAADQYYLKTVFVHDKNNSVSIQVNVFRDDEKTEYMDENVAKITIATSKTTKTTYESKFWGDSLKAKVKAKKATAADWKKKVIVTPNTDEATKESKPFIFSEENKTFEEFLADPILKGCTLQSLIIKLNTFVASGVEPTKVTKQGRVTTLSYDNIGLENAILFGYKEVGEAVADGETFPLVIETINGHISKISDESTNKMKYYLTMQGPNIHVPTWTE